MGVVENIDIDRFPKQGKDLGKKVQVCFNYNTQKWIEGIIVREDIEKPGRTIIKLEDNRYVLTTECQYQIIE